MREILFRGKTKESGEWVQGYFVYAKSDFDSEECREADIIPHNTDRVYKGEYNIVFPCIPETIGQYTGLTDKNGNKIFEGDIILFEDESPTNYEYHDSTEMRCGEIKFDGGEFYLTNRIAVEMTDLVYDNKLDGQIVGNIHDNPELLECDNE